MTRVLSGIVMAAGALAALLFFPPLALRGLVCVVAVLAGVEYLRLVTGSRSSVALLVAMVAITWLTAQAPEAGLRAAAVAVVLIAGASIVVPSLTSREAILGGFSVAYIGVPLGLLANINAVAGWRATLLLIATVVVSDSAQFYSGRAFGRRPLAPAISPKKTIEGAVGGFIAGTVFMAVAGHLVFPQSSYAGLAGLGFVVVLFGIAGDLFESRLKREAQVKDSSTLIPGHGGVLDRIDALLFATLAFSVYVDRTL
jgi:phosphatidate cytidylyltransferase